MFRSIHDCLLTSSTTIIKDNPRLTCRINGLEHTSPTRIILDKDLTISIKSNVVVTAKKIKTIIFFDSTNFNKVNKMQKLGVKLIKISCNQSDNFDLTEVLKKIKLMGFSRIFLESGIKLTEAFLANFLVDDFHLFIAEKNIGQNGKNSFKKNIKILNKSRKILNGKVNLLGDALLSFRLK